MSYSPNRPAKTASCAEPPIEGLLEIVALGFPHPDFGEGVTAVAVPRSGAALTEAAILAALADRGRSSRRRGGCFWSSALQRNAMGKVQKAALREAYRDVYRGC